MRDDKRRDIGRILPLVAHHRVYSTDPTWDEVIYDLLFEYATYYILAVIGAVSTTIFMHWSFDLLDWSMARERSSDVHSGRDEVPGITELSY